MNDPRRPEWSDPTQSAGNGYPPSTDPDRLSLLDAETRELIATTERFHARLTRLDRGWRQRDMDQPSAIARLRERLGGAVAR